MINENYKWQFKLSIKPDYRRMDAGWKVFVFGIFKFKHLPPMGEIVQKCCYKGFLIKFRIWLPIEKY